MLTTKRTSLVLCVTAWLVAGPAVVSARLATYDVSLGSYSYNARSSEMNQGESIQAPGFIDLSDLSFAGYQRVPDGRTSTVDIFITAYPRGCFSPLIDGCSIWSHGCCTEQAIAKGKCTKPGALWVDKETFNGYHVSVAVPHRRDWASKQLLLYQGRTQIDRSATYFISFHHCGDDVVDIHIKGSAAWKSKYGYLPPANLEDLAYSCWVTTLLLVTLFWFGHCIYKKNERATTLEKLILVSLFLALSKESLVLLYFAIWNETGHAHTDLNLIRWVVYAVLRGIFGIVLALVCSDRGGVHDILGRAIIAIVVFSAANLRRSFRVLRLTAMHRLTHHNLPMTFWSYMYYWMQTVVDIFFASWVCITLRNTIIYLERTDHSILLDRCRKLRCLLYPAIAYISISRCICYALQSRYPQPYILLHAETFFTWWIVLIGVAVLSRPRSESGGYRTVEESLAMAEANECFDTLELTDISSQDGTIQGGGT